MAAVFVACGAVGVCLWVEGRLVPRGAERSDAGGRRGPVSVQGLRDRDRHSRVLPLPPQQALAAAMHAWAAEAGGDPMAQKRPGGGWEAFLPLAAGGRRLVRADALPDGTTRVTWVDRVAGGVAGEREAEEPCRLPEGAVADFSFSRSHASGRAWQWLGWVPLRRAQTVDFFRRTLEESGWRPYTVLARGLGKALPSLSYRRDDDVILITLFAPAGRDDGTDLRIARFHNGRGMSLAGGD